MAVSNVGAPFAAASCVRRGVSLVLLAAATTVARPARADEPPEPAPAAVPPSTPVVEPLPPPGTATAAEERASPYRFHAGLEIPIFAVAGATLLTALVPTSPAPCLPRCEVPSSMNALDREALGARSDAAGTVADVALAAVLAAPHLANLIATRGKKSAWLEDIVVSAEATLIATGTSQVLKSGVGRYSPRVYDERLTFEQRSHPESTRSFWSSHTATATAAATSFAVSYWLRHPGSPWRWVVLGGLEATALGVGLMTILAGWHFPTDVAAGALFGAASGVAVPMLHTVF